MKNAVSCLTCCFLSSMKVLIIKLCQTTSVGIFKFLQMVVTTQENFRDEAVVKIW